jgi:hypothetical protein
MNGENLNPTEVIGKRFSQLSPDWQAELKSQAGSDVTLEAMITDNERLTRLQYQILDGAMEEPDAEMESTYPPIFQMPMEQY